jgi:hypothetical protein
MSKKDIAIIAFASGEPYLSESRNLETLCERANINFVLYDSDWLHETDFYTENKDLLDSKKSGYCAWKPYIILDALKRYEKVLYLDSSMLFLPEHIEKYFDKDDSILSTEIFGMYNKFHTKHLTFQIMNCLSDRYQNATQVWAGTILADKRAVAFLEEWLSYCVIKDCISDEYNKSEEPLVKYCLYDQNIYSILYEKYNLRKENNIQDGYFWFADTREYPHRDTIKQVFGNHCMERQDSLIMRYAEQYITNGSCCYDPRAYTTS